jgi:hypothetical protein
LSDRFASLFGGVQFSKRDEFSDQTPFKLAENEAPALQKIAQAKPFCRSVAFSV